MSELLSMIRAGSKPVIGMIQLDPLPGGSRYASRGVEAILKRALDEADTLAANDVDVLMVQNLGDLPVSQTAVASQVAWMTRVVAEVRARFGRPVGINLLENDAEAMLAIASAAGADFVRIKVYVGAMLTPFGVESGQAYAAIRARNAWDVQNVAIFADVHDRTGVPLATGGLAEDLDHAIRLGGADGVVLTGKTLWRDARIRQRRAKAFRRGADPRRRRRQRRELRRGRAGRRRCDRQLRAQGFGRCVREICSRESLGLHGGGQARPRNELSGREGSRRRRRRSEGGRHMWKLLRICCALLAAAVVLASGGAAEAKIKVAFVTSESGIGDRSFNDMMDQGMKRAVKDLGYRLRRSSSRAASRNSSRRSPAPPARASTSSSGRRST